MTSSECKEMHHALGVGVGAHSSQKYDFLIMQGNASCIGGGGGRHKSLMYDFIKIRCQICATTGQTTSIITLGTIVQIWTQGGGSYLVIKVGGLLGISPSIK